MTAYRLGRLGFEIDGTHPVAACLREEFAPIEVTDPEGIALRFDFVDAIEPLRGAHHILPLRILDDAFATENGGLGYQVSRRAGVIEVLVRPVPRSRGQSVVPKELLRAADWNHLTPEETVAKNFVYNVFDYLSQLAQLPLGQSYLHASSFERGGEAAALIAWGGIGKTSAMLKLVLEDGWRFLSDDLVAIDSSGMLWRSPKRLQVYGYNVAGQERLRRRLMDGRSAVDRAAWALRLAVRGPRGVRRRVSAERLVGPDAVATHGRLAHAFFVERADAPAFGRRALPVEELARRAATTLLRELQPFVDLSTAMYAGGRHPVLPSVSDLFENSRRVLEQALGAVRPWAISLPLHAGPDEVSDYLRAALRETTADGP